MPEGTIGIARGAGALFGVTSTLCYAWQVRRCGLEHTALQSIWLLVALLAPCVVSIFVPDFTLSAVLLCGGVILSRLGLWSFDMAVTQVLTPPLSSPPLTVGSCVVVL